MAQNDGRRLVEFDHNCSPYSSGERAMFNAAQAAKLVSRGIAHYVDVEALQREAEENFQRELERKQAAQGGDDEDEDNDDTDTSQSDDDDESDDEGSEDGVEEDASAGSGSGAAKKGKSGKRRRVRA